MTFRARNEPLIVAALAIDGVVSLALATWLVVEARDGRGPAGFYLVAVVLLAGFLFAAWMLLGVRYEVAQSELVIRTGPFRRRIPLSSIDEVLPTQGSPLAPDWAGGRLQVLFAPPSRPRPLFLTPAEPAQFLERLASEDPGLRLQTDRVARAHPA